MTTLPRSLAVSMLGALLTKRRDDTIERSRNNPREQSPDKRAAREESARQLTREIMRLRDISAAKPKGTLPAEIVGLLCAVVCGHGEAVRDLEDAVERLAGPDTVARIESIPSTDVAGLLHAIMEILPAPTSSAGS